MEEENQTSNQTSDTEQPHHTEQSNGAEQAEEATGTENALGSNFDEGGNGSDGGDDANNANDGNVNGNEDGKLQDIVNKSFTEFTKDDFHNKISRFQNTIIDCKVVLGKTRLPIESILKFNKGSVIELKTKIDDDLDIETGGLKIALGEILVDQQTIQIEVKEVE